MALFNIYARRKFESHDCYQAADDYSSEAADSVANESIIESFTVSLREQSDPNYKPRDELLFYGISPVSNRWQFVLVPDESYYILLKFLDDIDKMVRHPPPGLVTRPSLQSSLSNPTQAQTVAERCEQCFLAMANWLPPRMFTEIATDRYKQ